ncbi:MAG: hypothetical protein P1P84_13325 [Deferrisomatales bacterium]|nr:hypothetical protein [Deferrisomatales bacterium]
MDRRRASALLLGAALLLAGGYACVASHLTKDIQPPGGCDQCHRGKIGGTWEISVVPVSLGREGGVVDARDVILREVRQVPYHSAVPTKRLEVFAAAAPAEVVGGDERGIQCFVCHRSPDPPHESLRGQFNHPWNKDQ